MSTTLRVCVHRALGRSALSALPLVFEIATVFFRAQGHRAFRIAGDGTGVATARRMIDTLVFRLPQVDQVQFAPECNGPVNGRWFVSDRPGPLTLHFHGGGYVFSPATTDNLIAAVVCAIGGRAFVPDYRLAPEHPFPSQLDDALRCYEWLRSEAGSASQIVLSGDSSGGHLLLALLLALSQKGQPLPAASVVISPWTDPGGVGASLSANEPYDWMTGEMLDRMAAWAGSSGGVSHPLFHLVDADVSALKRVLIHAGENEICIDMVQAFVARARRAGADVQYRSWPNMNHNFHGFGNLLPHSREALKQIADFVAAHVGDARRA